MNKSPSTPEPSTPCPTCKEAVSRGGSPAWPFCSSRCQMVDLGRWMKEDYRIPDKTQSADVEAAAQAVGQLDPSDSFDSSEEF